MKLRKCSLFAAVVGALLLTAAFAPRANAILAVLYNFEDSTLGASPPDFTSELIGLQTPTMTFQYAPASMVSVAGLAFNPAAGDLDVNNLALGLTNAGSNNLGFLQFHVDTQTLVGMSLSLAANTSLLGFNSVELAYSNDGFASDSHHVGTEAITSLTGQTIPFGIPAAAEGQSDITFRLVFNGATFNGEVPQNTVIDNIQLTTRAVIPEPASVVGALLGACGLCWNQRRRLISLLRLRCA